MTRGEARFTPTLHSLIEGDNVDELKKLLTVLQKAEKDDYYVKLDTEKVATELLCEGSRLGRPNVVELAISLPRFFDRYDLRRAKIYAAERGHGSVIAKMMEKNKFGYPNLDLDEALVIAASRGFVTVTQAILESGHHIRFGRQPRDDNYYTALDKAAKNGHTACFNALLKYRPLDEQAVCKLLKLAFFKRYSFARRFLQARVSENNESAKITEAV